VFRYTAEVVGHLQLPGL